MRKRIKITLPDHDSFNLLSSPQKTSENDVEKTETDNLLELGISRDSYNVNLTETNSETNSDEESGIGEFSTSSSTSDISNMTVRTHPIVCDISLSDETSRTKLSKCISFETFSKELKETDLKLTSPVNRTNNDEKTDLQQSANNEQALALRESHSSINVDQERGINWDLVFQKSADLVNPYEIDKFFIELFGAVGKNNAGRIIAEETINHPHNANTRIFKLFLRWREHAGNKNIELHIEKTFKELGWNSNCEEFRKIMSDPPLTQTNTLSPMVTNKPLLPAGHSAFLSLDFPIHDESTIELAHQQDDKIETRVEQTIISNGVTRKIVHQKTSEIIRHGEYQCLRGGNSELKNTKHKLEPPSDDHIDKMSIPNKSRKISESLESSEHTASNRNDEPCEKNESSDTCIIGNNNNQPKNNEKKETKVKLNRNYKCGKAKLTSTLARYKDSRHNSRRHKYWKESKSLHSNSNPLHVLENGNRMTLSDEILRSTKWNENKMNRRKTSTDDLYHRGQISSTKTSELPIDSGYSSSRSESGLYKVDEESPSSRVSHIVKLIERLLELKQPLDKEDYDFYQTHIINRITMRYQTKEQVLELKIDELKNKNKGYFLQSGDRLLGFSEDERNSLELYVKTARSTICNSSETDIVFINYDGVPLRDVAY